ncbi:MAG: biotin transporter BioY [Candidatus Gygaella obscura]|nr:biotin transporter BioY [Candidatus Gygaella obscura]
MKDLNPVLEKDQLLEKVLFKTIAVIAFVFLTAMGAYIRVPLWFTPVPFTLQTLFVLLGACVLGKYLGTFTQVIYIALGVLGAPLFTKSGAGLYYFLGPTAGYLAGFLLSSVFIGVFLKPQKSFREIFFIFSAASLLILLCGAVWLKIIFRLNYLQTFILGVMPFVIGDAIKSLIASLFYMKFRSRISSLN